MIFILAPTACKPDDVLDVACPDNPDYKCGHSKVDTFLSIQQNANLSSTEGDSSMEMKKFERPPKPFYQIEKFVIGDYVCTGSQCGKGYSFSDCRLFNRFSILNLIWYV